jgi:hypothetical protein
MARPQKISDDTILAVIRTLQRAHAPATGVHVRRELSRRHGLRAGTDRVYRLLRQSAPIDEVPEPRADPSQLAQERDEAVQRARLAELREVSTQNRTALEIDSLRQALRSLGVDPFTMEPLGSKPFRV